MRGESDGSLRCGKLSLRCGDAPWLEDGMLDACLLANGVAAERLAGPGDSSSVSAVLEWGDEGPVPKDCETILAFA